MFLVEDHQNDEAGAASLWAGTEELEFFQPEDEVAVVGPNSSLHALHSHIYREVSKETARLLLEEHSGRLRDDRNKFKQLRL